MTHFTDSVYERMMVQRPQCEPEKKAPIRKPAVHKKKHSSDGHYRDIILPKKERSVEK